MNDDGRAVREINDALLNVPMSDRLAALACSVISDEAHACDAVLDLISVSAMLARQLSAGQRLRIAWHMLEEIQAIGARWN
jgi:hypothetical protein